MRVFLAIELNDEVRRELTRVIDAFKSSNLIEAKYVEPENLHLTLKFFGEVSKEKFEDILKKLAVFNFKNFEAKINGVGYFSENFIRVLWTGIEDENKLDELVFEIRKIFGKENKKFSKHVTLARIKKVHDKMKFKEFVRNFKTNPIKFKINKIILKSSVLKKEGPEYSNIYTKKFD